MAEELSMLLRVSGLTRGVGKELALRMCPGLSLEQPAGWSAEISTTSPCGAAFDVGFSRPGRVAGSSLCARLVEAIASIRREGLPATFLYLYDEVWQLGDVVRRSVGPGYRLTADVWAWQIAPGQRGWPAHRGVTTRLDRAAPELLNTWIALSDVEVDRACMHFVPLDDDPAYPYDLASTAVPDGKAVAAPLAAGEALVWNANTLHWGGACAAAARGPRVSCSFSLVREDAADRMGLRLADPAPRTLEERLDLIASQVCVYGEGQPDVRPEVLEWARANVAMRAAVAKLSLSRDLSGT